MWNPKVSRKVHFCIWKRRKHRASPFFDLLLLCFWHVIYRICMYIYVYIHVICILLIYVDVDTYTVYLNSWWKQETYILFIIYNIIQYIYIYIIGTYIYLGPSVCDLPITWSTRNLRWLCAVSADVRCPHTWLKLGWQSMILNNFTCTFPHILQYIYTHMYTCCTHVSTHVSASPSYKLVKPSSYSYIMLYLSLKPG